VTQANPQDILIVGAGVGGLTLALALHARGIPCRVYESAPGIKAVGVGINLLPHATRELGELGLEDALARAAVTTKESCFFNRFGQLVWREPLGRYAGYPWPQFSIHRGDLQAVLLEAFRARIGEDRLHLGWRCTGVDPAGSARFVASEGGEPHAEQRGAAVIGCDGIHSAVRAQLYPEEGGPVYSGVNMWRGVTRWKPFLSGAGMTRVGWLATGKLVIYPIRDRIDAEGRQLVNWVAEIETPQYKRWDWNRPAALQDFIAPYADWHFDWLDVPAMLAAADTILEFPMVDKNPLPRWSFGRVTLLGDAAHPMYPRGSNGAGQAIVDARALADALAVHADPAEALAAYEARRREATSKVVLQNRSNPPDAILREVYLRTGDKPFARIEDVISAEELRAMSEGYKRVAGYDRDSLGGGAAR
jgi:2-polyprenyl-6-methoxyphenol hydroxylase-like FAD-dependent oxidoreductase